MVEATIRAIDPNVSFRAVTASRGKVARAEPIAALYEQNRVHHLGCFPQLEDEMTAFTTNSDRKTAGFSPGRVDALVWALTDLMIAAMKCLFGFTAMLPYITVLGLSVIAGFIVQGNFSNLTSGVLAVAAPRHRGATIGLYSCIGFGAGFLGTLLFGVTLDQFGGTTHLAAWILSFGTCGLACMTGAAASVFLRRDVWQRAP
jgi:hypothetical protein